MSEYDKKRYKENKEKEKKRSLEYYYANKEKSNHRSKAWREKNKSRVKELNKIWYSKNKVKAKEHSKKLYYSNKEKALEVNRTWYSKNKDKVKNNYLKRNYGMSLDEYNTLLTLQNNVCAICFKKEILDKSLIVDHNHETGKVRGLLCDKCNFAIGLLSDNPETVMSAFYYLIKYQ